MRGVTCLVLAAVLLSFGVPARAAGLMACTSGCLTDPSGLLQVDYTVPPDGLEYRWDLWSDASHPTALITLDAANETLSIMNTSMGGGLTSVSLAAPVFKWNEVVTPGHTMITVQAPADFDFCASHPAAGTVCSADNMVWGNGSTFLRAGVADPVMITFARTAIPEPTTWSLLIGGFLAIGWALRRQRTAAPQSA